MIVMMKDDHDVEDGNKNDDDYKEQPECCRH